MTIKIRPIAEGDKARWFELWRAYLVFYKVALDASVTEHTWQRIVAGRDGFSAFVAAEQGASGERLVGFAICLLHPSTWSDRPSCYLEDLFVEETARGKGAGRALIETIYNFASALDCHRVYWVTEEDNVAARALYDRVARYSGMVQYRRAGD